MKIVIPEYKTLDVNTLFLDFNGTIAVDGVIPQSVKERLILLAENFQIFILTAEWKNVGSLDI
jgi:soluble P-type ATPase